MQKNMKRTKILSLLLAATLVVSSAFSGIDASAAKKPKLSKKKETIAVGQVKTIKVKNGNKKAKVTWKLTKKKYAKITKTNKKGNKAYAKVKGSKKGKTVLQATYKLGKKKTTLKCTITVKKATPTVAPQPTVVPPTANPTIIPTTPPATATPVPEEPTPTQGADEPTPTPTQGADEPTPSPTTEPTPEPEPTVDPAIIEAGESVTLSADTAHPAGCEWFFTDPSANVYKDGKVSFLLPKDGNPGAGFFFNADKAAVDLNEYDKLVMIVRADADNVAARIAITDSQEFKWDENVNWLASANGKVNKAYSKLTISLANIKESKLGYGVAIQHCGWDGSTPANPTITIHSITLVKSQSSGEDDQPTASPVPLTAEMVDAPFAVDGTADEAWTDIEAVPFVSRVGSEGAAPADIATAKLAWDATALYGLVEVKDTNIDYASGNDYERDGIEFFLDEDNCGTVATSGNDWVNPDAFQYRFTGLVKNEDGTTSVMTDGFAGGIQAARDKYPNIETEFTFTEGGYIVEFKIPFADEKEVGTKVGFDAVAMDCANGARLAEVFLNPTEGRSYWNNREVFPELTLVDEVKAEPEITPTPKQDVVMENAAVIGGGTISVDNGVITYTNGAGVFVPLVNKVKAGESLKVTVYGSATGTNPRMWLSAGFNDANVSNQIGKDEFAFGKEFILTSTNDNADCIEIKAGSWDTSFETLTITKIVVVDPNAPVPTPTAIEGTFVDKEQTVALTQDKAPLEKPEWFFTDPSNYTFNADGTLTMGIIGNNAAASLYFNADKSPINLADYERMEIVLSANIDGLKMRGGVTKSAGIAYDNNIISETSFDLGTADTTYVVNLSNVAADAIGYGFAIQNKNWEGSPADPVVTIKSVKLIRKVGDYYNYAAPSDAKEFLFSYERKNGDTVEETVDMEIVNDYMDKYDDFLAPLDLAMNKATGFEVIEYHGDNDVKFVKTGANTATITGVYGDVTKTANVVFAKEGNVTTATVSTAANTVTVSVDSANPNKALVSKNGVDGYVVEGTKTADGYTAKVTTPAGNYATITKTADGYVVNVTKESVENRDFTVAYR